MAAWLVAFGLVAAPAPPSADACAVAKAAFDYVLSGKSLHLTPARVGPRTRSEASLRVPPRFRAKDRGERLTLADCPDLGLTTEGGDLIVGDPRRVEAGPKAWLSDPVFSADRKTARIAFGWRPPREIGMGMTFVLRDGEWAIQDGASVWFTAD